MNPTEILKQAERNGVFLRIEGGSIRYRTKSGPIPARLRAAIAVHKPAIRTLLAATPPPLTAAERRAAADVLVVRYRLADGLGGWATLRAVGWSFAEAEADLRARYGARLLAAVEYRPDMSESTPTIETAQEAKAA